MTLQQLEELTRPQFLWDKAPGRQWNVVNASGSTNTETTIGMVVFAGVAHMNGFTDNEIRKHIGIERVAYTRHLNTFKKAYEWEDAAEKNDAFAEGSELPKRIMTKARLILNAINLTYNKKPMIKLSELGY